MRKAELRMNEQLKHETMYPQYCRLGIDACILNDRDGIDPFEEPGYLRKLHDYARGRRIDGHPNIYSGALKPIRLHKPGNDRAVLWL